MKDIIWMRKFVKVVDEVSKGEHRPPAESYANAFMGDANLAETSECMTVFAKKHPRSSYSAERLCVLAVAHGYLKQVPHGLEDTKLIVTAVKGQRILEPSTFVNELAESIKGLIPLLAVGISIIIALSN